MRGKSSLTKSRLLNCTKQTLRVWETSCRIATLIMLCKFKDWETLSRRLEANWLMKFNLGLIRENNMNLDSFRFLKVMTTYRDKWRMSSSKDKKKLKDTPQRPHWLKFSTLSCSRPGIWIWSKWWLKREIFKRQLRTKTKKLRLWISKFNKC